MQLFELPAQLLGRPDLPAINVENRPDSNTFQQLLERQQSDPPPRSRVESRQQQDQQASRADNRPDRERQPSAETRKERSVRVDTDKVLQAGDDTAQVEATAVSAAGEATHDNPQASSEQDPGEADNKPEQSADGSEAVVVAVGPQEGGAARSVNQPISGPLAFAQRTASDGEVAAQKILSASAVVAGGAAPTAEVDSEAVADADKVGAKAAALAGEPLSAAPAASFKTALDGQPGEQVDDEQAVVEEGESVELSLSGSDTGDEQESEEGDGTGERFGSSRANGKEVVTGSEKSSFKNTLAGLAGVEKLPGAPVAGVDQSVMDRMVSAINKGQSVQKTVGESGASTTDATTGMAGLGASSATGSNSVQGVRGGLTPNLQRAESFDQVIDRTLQMVRGGEREITLRLSPDHLGELHIRVATGSGGLTAELMAQTTVAKELLESQQQRLQQALLDNGANAAQVNVSLTSRDGAAFGGRDGGSDGPPRPASENHDDSVTPPVTAQVSTRAGLNVVA